MTAAVSGTPSPDVTGAPYQPAPTPPGDPTLDPDDLWVFGYGSLVWRPGFTFVETQPAQLGGFRRDMCLLSYHYRGTHDVPGLVCGLMIGAGCSGRAYRIARVNADAALEYLDRRELITDIYIPRHLPIALASGRSALARVYVADTAHGQFVGDWSDAEKVRHIVQGHGSEGRSLDYLRTLVQHLEELGIADAHMEALLTAAVAADSQR
jgi:cation transport protein ChaC